MELFVDADIVEDHLREESGRGLIEEVIMASKRIYDHDELYDWLEWAKREKLDYKLSIPFDESTLGLSAEGALDYLWEEKKNR